MSQGKNVSVERFVYAADICYNLNWYECLFIYLLNDGHKVR